MDIRHDYLTILALTAPALAGGAMAKPAPLANADVLGTFFFRSIFPEVKITQDFSNVSELIRGYGSRY